MTISIVYVPCRDSIEAKKIARYLLKNKLVVCCNLIPKVDSIYRWKGKIEETKEAVLIVKTKSSLKDKAIAQIKKVHSYESPVILSWDIKTTTQEVASWVNKETL